VVPHHLFQGPPQRGHGVFRLAQPPQELVSLCQRPGERGVALLKFVAQLAYALLQLDTVALIDLLPQATLNLRLEPVPLVSDSPQLGAG